MRSVSGVLEILMRAWYHAYDVAARAAVIGLTLGIPLLAIARIPIHLPVASSPPVEDEEEWTTLPALSPKAAAELESAAKPPPGDEPSNAAGRGSRSQGKSKNPGPVGKYEVRAGFTGNKKPGGCSEKRLDSITKRSSGQFDVERAFVRKYTDNLDAASRLAAVERVRGKGANGYKLSRLKTCGALYQLGLREGDVVEEVNGRSLTDLVSAYGALKALKKDKRITLSIHRKGKPMTLRYSIQ